jgi:plastocyanin
VSDQKASPGDAVITAFLEEHAHETSPRSSGQATIVQSAGRFEPGVLLVDPGTTVHFANKDGIYHNLFSVSPAKKFDLGSVAPGHERQVHFDQVGIVTVYCELHPKEVGYVVVAPRRSAARPSQDGAYQLAGLAPGAYEVRAWHPTLGSQTRHIDLPAHGQVTVDFNY